MKLINWFNIALVSVSMLTFMGSCIATETLEPSRPGEKEKNGDEIVLNLSTPDDVKTRSENHEGFTLRYVAKLIPYQSKGSSVLDYEKMDRKEQLVDENDNRIVFTATEDTKYLIVVFADYIPSGSSPDASGMYKDYAYDTSLPNDVSHDKKPTRIQLKPIPGNSSTEYKNLSPLFFNNDNYDCFSHIEVVTKDNKTKELQFPLTRAVAMIQFRDKSENRDKFSKVTFKSFKFPNQFEMDGQMFSTQTTLTNYEANADDINTLDSQDGTFLYFYILAQSSTSRLSLTCDIDSENAKNPVSIIGQEIEFKKNFKTILTGNLLPQLNQINPEESNQIILNVKCEEGWGDPSMEQELKSN